MFCPACNLTNHRGVLLSPLATAGKGTPPKTGIASNILDVISQGSESQHALEKCIAYSPSFEDFAQVNNVWVRTVWGDTGPALH